MKFNKTALVASMTAAGIISSQPSFAEHIVLDKMAVTVTRDARPTKDISQNISVVDKEQIERLNMLNVSEALQNIPGVQAESTSGGYSTKLYIRGAGIRAPYGVREIMVLRDGVPITDPDSFTRFDFIDTQDIEQIEVVKGPGSIYAAGSAGGTIQILSKSVFDTYDNRIKAGYGTHDSHLLNLRYGGKLSDRDYYSFTATQKQNGSNWRENNHFHSEQASLKYGHIFGDESTLETEISYTKSYLDLPARLTEAEFKTFEDSGEQRDGSYQWQDSSRDSDILFVNVRYEKEFGDLIFKPRFYMNKWGQFHPVTGMINDSEDNMVLGTDLELKWNHSLFGHKASLIAGVTARNDSSDDSKRYTYRDVDTTLTNVASFGPPNFQNVINSTLFDNKGDLASVSDTDNMLYGIYFQETFRPLENLTVDLSYRYDQIHYDKKEIEYIDYDFGGRYYDVLATPNQVDIDEKYHLDSWRAGFSYALNHTYSLYLNIGYAEQIPSDSEVATNLAANSTILEASESTNYEIGLKARSRNYHFDMAFYQTKVENDIVQSREFGQTSFQNAGKTEKKGFEFSGEYQLVDGFWFGANYAFSDYEYEEFSEIVYTGGPHNEDRSGNQLPYIPRHYYGLSARYEHPSGLSGSVRTRNQGEYYTSNDNTNKYEGYDWITDVMLGYETGHHVFRFNVYNLFDEHYAAEAKGSAGDVDYRVAAPRTAMASYQLNF